MNVLLSDRCESNYLNNTTGMCDEDMYRYSNAVFRLRHQYLIFWKS